MSNLLLLFVSFFVFSSLLFLFGIRVVRPTNRGLIETFGKFSRFAEPGFHWVFPVIQSLVYVNVTENMVRASSQDIITKDNLNAKVDAQIYYKVRADEEGCKASEYNVSDYQRQMVALARTTLRNVIGKMSLTDANQDRGQINKKLFEEIQKEIQVWGIDLVRVEIEEIEPPADVQEAMNRVVKAENEKLAAVDFAKAEETKADGERMAMIKTAEGRRQSAILDAQGRKEASVLVARGEAEAIQLVSEAADKYFRGNAVELKRLETAMNSMQHNTKYVLSSDIASLISSVMGGGVNESIA